MRFKPRFYVGLEIFLSAEGCGCLAEGLRFDWGQYGSFTVFAVYQRFPAQETDFAARTCTTAQLIIYLVL